MQLLRTGVPHAWFIQTPQSLLLKKQVSLQTCINFLRLKNVLVKNKHHLLLMFLKHLKRATIFTKLDLRNAWSVVVQRRRYAWKTASNMPLGHFKYFVRPFSSHHGPSSCFFFLALINVVLRVFLEEFIFVYLDDILIYMPNQSEDIRLRGSYLWLSEGLWLRRDMSRQILRR